MSIEKDTTKRNRKILSIDSLRNSSAGVILEPTNIEMNGNKEAIIEGCKSISQYDENVIIINVDKMVISFFGRNMEIKCMNADSMVIRGFISSIEFDT